MMSGCKLWVDHDLQQSKSNMSMRGQHSSNYNLLVKIIYEPCLI